MSPWVSSDYWRSPFEPAVILALRCRLAQVTGA